MLHFFAKRLKKLHEVERDERGFTLIELLIVVIIIGILAAIAIPTFLAQREKAQIATCKSDTRNAAEAAVLYAADNDASGNDFGGLTVDGPAVPNLTTEGFNQTETYTTTVNVDAVDETQVTISTTCGNGNSASWTTTGGAFNGEVQYPAP